MSPFMYHKFSINKTIAIFERLGCAEGKEFKKFISSLKENEMIPVYKMRELLIKDGYGIVELTKLIIECR